MAELQFPDLAVVQLVLAGDSGPKPLELPGVVFEVHLFARRKNDYHLGPFFSDAGGQIQISTEACRYLVEAEHESSLMDYAGLAHCDPVVTIRHLSGEEVARAAESRRTAWRQLLRGERHLFRSIEELIALYEAAPNGLLEPGGQLLRVRWDGSESHPAYQYPVTWQPAP